MSGLKFYTVPSVKIHEGVLLLERVTKKPMTGSGSLSYLGLSVENCRHRLFTNKPSILEIPLEHELLSRNI